MGKLKYPLIITILSVLLVAVSTALVLKVSLSPTEPVKHTEANENSNVNEYSDPDSGNTPTDNSNGVSQTVKDHELTYEQIGITQDYKPTPEGDLLAFSGKSPLNRKIEAWVSSINGSGEMAGKIYPYGRATAAAGEAWKVSVPKYAFSNGRNIIEITFSVSDSDGEYGYGLARTSFDLNIPEFRSISVNWIQPQKKVSNKQVSQYLGTPIKTVKEMDPYSSEVAYTLLGSISDGQYSGDNLYRISNDCPIGSDVCIDVLAIADRSEKKFHVLKRYSGHWNDGKSPISGIADGSDFLVIPDLEAPTAVKLSKEGYALTRVMVATGLAYPKEYKKIGTSADGTSIYQYSDNRPAIKLKNGELIKYEINIPFYDSRIPSITWIDGSPAKNDYTQLTQSGCGGTAWMVQENGFDPSKFDIAGHTSTDESVYFLKDQTDAKEMYENMSAWNSEKPTYEQFLASKPVFYWQDPFGRLIRWNTTSAMPMAECGKPVVYLYPTKTEQVSVKLGSNIEVTKSEPKYENGWTVTAEPNGKLTAVDGKTYPYLYWDGNGASYEMPKEGWVVKSSDADSFLSAKLAALGLNAKESADFREFWTPIVSNSPYARISFVPQAEWSKSAPLSITPAPQTTIRVFMDWQPLSAPIAIEPQTLPPTPVRTGFTAVEWGGLLYK